MASLLTASPGTRFVFIRHGERDHSVPVASNALIPLTERGHRQASLTGQHLVAQGLKPDAVYSSPFLRCLQTSEKICEELGMPYSILPIICELLTAREFPAHPREHFLFHSAPDAFPVRFPLSRLELMAEFVDPEHPETMALFPQRVEAVLEELSRRHPGETVVCVSHGCFLEVLVDLLYADTMSTYPGNLCIADFVFTKGSATLTERLCKGPLGMGYSHLPQDMWSGLK